MSSCEPVRFSHSALIFCLHGKHLYACRVAILCGLYNAARWVSKPMDHGALRCVLVILLVLLVVLVLVHLESRHCAALLLVAAVPRASHASRVVTGGLRRKVPKGAGKNHLVIDTLNLTHWLVHELEGHGRQIELCDVIDAIDRTSACLKEAHTGRVMFVTKDRESVLNEPRHRAAYAAAAARNKVYVYVVERYDPRKEPSGPKREGKHTELGRDDFLMGVLAHEYQCSVLTRDRFRDFDELRASVKPFQVLEYSPHSQFPGRLQYRPSAAEFGNVKRPPRVDYDTYFGEV